MKSNDLQKIVFSKCHNGNTSTKILRDLNNEIALRTIKRCCQMIRRSGYIALSAPSGWIHFVRTKGNIQKVKYHLCRKKREAARKLLIELGISGTNVFGASNKKQFRAISL